MHLFHKTNWEMYEIGIFHVQVKGVLYRSIHEARVIKSVSKNCIFFVVVEKINIVKKRLKLN